MNINIDTSLKTITVDNGVKFCELYKELTSTMSESVLCEYNLVLSETKTGVTTFKSHLDKINYEYGTKNRPTC
tara:strand:+ start:65 stop:283 length:219 start_codon:yes stop_codon:yes gene_type:complete